MQTDQTRASKLLAEERTTLRTVIAALVGIMLGIGLLYLSGLPGIWTGREAWQSVVHDLGALFIGTVAIGVMWELWGKRALLDEALAKAHLAEQIRAAGLTAITSSFYGDGWSWETLLGTTNHLDVFFAYGHTWRRICHNRLVEMAGREHNRIRVVLPDPEDEVSICSMADRFETTPVELKGWIYEAKDFFQDLPPKDTNLRENVTVYFRRGTTLFSYYILDSVAIITLYSHASKSAGSTMGPAPTLVVSRGSWMFDWLQDEFNRMVQGTDGRTKKLELEQNETP